ncbi:aryl-alcohol oxidase [Mycena galopus ATCC 62051]|nr:aryl-alcohol oxidase [Mycena galopus ATCC 62051]
MLIPASIVLAVFGAVGLCKVYENVADLPYLDYDFVIVGGNVVANRLTENADVSVLVLEAGVSNDGVLLSEVPFLLNSLLGDSVYSWNYTTTPQSGLNGRSISFPRAYMLGGCSSHNGMVYTRGAADDFDRYANLTGDDGWSWDGIFPYFLKHEKWTAPADNHHTLGEFDPAIHGKDGPISVSLNGFPWPAFEKTVMQTTKELPDEFPFNLDMNSGKPLGVSWLQSSIGGGERSTSATGYLAPEFISRANLHVLLHAQVSKLVNVTHSRGKPSFGGVEFRSGSSLFVAHAFKEIILSAGSVGTPHILLNSGIGAYDTLSALGIPQVVDLPSVGQNAHDQPFFALGWAVNSMQTLESITQNATRAAEGLAQWEASHTGPFVDSGIATHIAWLKLPPESPAFGVHADPSPGPGAPHLEFLLIPGGGIAGGISTPGIGNFITIGISLSSPVSRGSITINSSDSFAPPLIDPGFLNSMFDLLALRDGVALAQRFVGAPVWDGYLGTMTPDLTGLSDAELTAYIRDNAGQSFHIVGTAAMSARGAPNGVVDPDLQVKGVAGLSVIDAAVVPIVPAAHTQAITYAFAERGVDLVKQRWA